MFIKYHRLDIDVQRLYFESDELAEEMEKRFSNHKVPVLIDDGFEIWDTLAILEYLCERYPETNGLPTSVKARAVARSVCAEMHSSFAALRNDIPMNCRRYFPGYRISDPGKKDIDRIQRLWRHCRENYGADGPWLFGHFSIADAMFAPVVMRFRSVDISLDSLSQSYCDTLNRCEAVREWLHHARQETHRCEQDELDWPSEAIE